MTVYLVGAGPGDPGLLTRRGAALLAEAEVVVYDRLVDRSLLALARPGAELVDVGKMPGASRVTADGSTRQEGINRLLVDRGRSGRCVVRLKGGDPFLFGRGGEEAEALTAAGVDWEVVPGVTSAIAVPAVAGVPVTHRGLSTSVTVVTGHVGDAPASGGVDWEALGRAGGTLVVLMGIAKRAEIARRLLAAGRPSSTPVAVITWGTTAAQRIERTTLEHLADVALGPPAVLVIGAVAGLELGSRGAAAAAAPGGADGAGGAVGAAGAVGAVGAAGAVGAPGGATQTPSASAPRPLDGHSVVVTRPSTSSDELAAVLTGAGARVLVVPAIEVREPEDDGAALREAVERLDRYRWVVFTSANAVHRLVPLARDGRAFAGVGLAAVGDATAGALASYHLVADLVPARAHADALVEAFPLASESADEGLPAERPRATSTREPRVLFPCAAEARQTLPEGLRSKGWHVDEVVAYRTVPAEPPPAAMLGPLADAAAIVFSSPSAVHAYLGMRMGDGGPALPVPPVVVCGGPTTAAAARAAGLTVGAESRSPSADGILRSLVDALGGPARRARDQSAGDQSDGQQSAGAS